MKKYMDGNSLGLLSTDDENTILKILEAWKTLVSAVGAAERPPDHLRRAAGGHGGRDLGS